jgi:hypothetical protein
MWLMQVENIEPNFFALKKIKFFQQKISWMGKQI